MEINLLELQGIFHISCQDFAQFVSGIVYLQCLKSANSISNGKDFKTVSFLKQSRESC